MATVWCSGDGDPAEAGGLWQRRSPVAGDSGSGSSGGRRTGPAQGAVAARERRLDRFGGLAPARTGSEATRKVSAAARR